MTDPDLLNDLVIMLDLPRFGEVIAHVAAAFAEMRGIEEPDYEGEEMRELAISTWKHVCFMADREEFKASVSKDLERIAAPHGYQPPPPPRPEIKTAEHKPEFGFFEPPV